MGERARLEVIGGLYQAEAELLAGSNREQVLSAFARAKAEGFRLTISGARRSFGEQYLPREGGKVLDASALDRGATIMDTEPDGSIWVRAGGGTTFRDLGGLFPSHRPSCPPTTDTVTLSGALSACVHNSASYFANEVRAFTLLTPGGKQLSCAPHRAGLEGELFEFVPGSFGAFGVITDIEIRLRPHDPRRWILVHSVYAGPSRDGRYLDELERAAENPRFSEGAGAVVYGNRGHSIVFGDELLPPGERPRSPRALLTGEDVGFQSFTQSLVHRFPRLAERIVSRSYPQGIARWAPLKGFLYFQRSFDEAHRRMIEGGSGKAVLRLLGARQGLPICHSAWFFPRGELRAFMDGYFSVLDRYPGLEAIAEQQDLVLLGPSRYPSHSMGRTSDPIAVLTASFAVQRGAPSEERARDFFVEVSRRARDFSPGAKISLCKQLHATTDDLRAMHQGFIASARRLRAHVDPDQILDSRLLSALGVVDDAAQSSPHLTASRSPLPARQSTSA